MADEIVKTYPSTGLVDIIRLLGGFARGLLRNPFSLDPGLVLNNWIKDSTRRHNSENLIVNLMFRKILLATGRGLSEHILDQPPSTRTYAGGPTKVRGMSFLAPQALTICHDQQWQRLRPLNEQVLSIGDAPVLQQAILDQVHQAFSQPVSSIDDIRNCMGRVMLGVVFGETVAPAHLVQDIEVLFGYVQNPLKRAILGRTQRSRHERFYGTMRQLWEENQGSQDSSLLARAHDLAPEGNFEVKELMQQVPHWMFTFTGSGTDLLSRALTMVGSRPEVGDKVREEIAAGGPLDQSYSIGQLNYLEACLMETCRLFPPVTRTFHVAPQGDLFDDISIPAGMEILHCFTASHRDTSVDPGANNFEPERWLDQGSDRRSVYPNLFLSGARACPGESLILFICKAGIAILFEQHRVRPNSRALTRDPLPFSFPDRAVRFEAY